MPGRSSSRRILYLAAVLAIPAALLLVRGFATGTATLLERRYPPPGKMVSVGDYKLQLYCTGSASPTIVIEPGMGLDWVGWRFVIAKLQPGNRVCVYDRAGYGWSERGPKPRSALLEANELHTLLTSAQVPGPFILVAHSYGAYIARIYASRFRDSLAGVVLVEPSHEEEDAPGGRTLSPPASQRPFRLHDLLNVIPPLGLQRLRRMYEGQNAVPRDLRTEPRAYQDRYLVASSLTQLQLERNEYDSLNFTTAQVRETVFPRELPLTVITALHAGLSTAEHPLPELPPRHRELQLRLAQSSEYGRQILAEHSGHVVPLDDPDLIVSAVRDMVNRPQEARSE